MSDEKDGMAGCVIIMAFVVIALIVLWMGAPSQDEVAALRQQIAELRAKTMKPQLAEADPSVEILKVQLAEARAQQVWSPLAPLQAELQSLQHEIILLHKKIDGVKVCGDGAHCNCKKFAP
jgi:hypothetical protein